MRTIEQRMDQLKSSFEFSNKGELKRQISEQVREIVSLHEQILELQKKVQAQESLHQCLKKENSDLQTVRFNLQKEIKQEIRDHDNDVHSLLAHVEALDQRLKCQHYYSIN